VFDVLATGDLDMAVGVPTTTSLPVRLKEEYEVKLLLHFIPVDLVDR
jgi:hypothetical protein